MNFSAAERARRADPQALPRHDGIFLARLIALARELQRDARGEPFGLAVKFAQNFLELPELASASRLLRELERRHVLECVRRGTRDTPEAKGVPSLYRFNEPQS
jgi:hypothetical protein